MEAFKLPEHQQAPIGIECIAQALLCPSCGSELDPSPIREDVDFCLAERKAWISAIIQSPDCVPTEELESWDSEVVLRPTKVFVNKMSI